MRWTVVCLTLLAAVAPAKEDIKEKVPGERTKGKVYAWKSKDGLVYRYYIPKKFDPERGANLTVILHGSNLSAGWGFWNHKAGAFRPDDIIVSPDGTTPNGRGGHNFLGEKKDAKRLRALLGELKGMFKVRATYLYGHSQGSFFALYYAGEYPDDVQGVVAHASGVWTWTQQGPKGHGIAFVLMHGTQDPVVPYGQSVGGYDSYRKAKYPIVRLRSLESWNHWPAEHNGPVPHTSQQLAWVEGMTTNDPERLKACFEVLANNKSKERHDYAGLYTLSRRLVELPTTPADVKARAQKAIPAIEKLAAEHVKALSRVDKLGKAPPAKGWHIHMTAFLRSFMDVPQRDELHKKWKSVLDKHDKDGLSQMRKYWKARGKKPADAFKAGTAAMAKGYLYYNAQDAEMRNELKKWRKDAKKLGISKKAIKDYDAIAPVIDKAFKDGYRAYDGINRKAPKF
jgi:poly(3-hydroxybutyrate) depolymerase